ncbi:MAG: UDP-2,3-diacylglucosamine diphosphatase LpxI [Nitrospirota bacterium]
MSGPPLRKLGLIAGNGRFPVLFADAAKQAGFAVTAVAHRGETPDVLDQHVDDVRWIKVGQLGHMIEHFKSAGVETVVMAGGIKKTRMFTEYRPDWRAVKVLARLRHLKDDVLLRAVADELESEGITVGDATRYLPSLIAEAGVLTTAPSREQWEDVRFGAEMVRTVGRLEIGQCVVVKNRTVLAVEAIEGTDEAIRRGGRLAHGGAVVVKMAKPEQDLRFDIPAVGPNTIASMQEVGAAVLAVEAGKTLMLDKADLLEAARKAGISVVGITGDEVPGDSHG